MIMLASDEPPVAFARDVCECESCDRVSTCSVIIGQRSREYCEYHFGAYMSYLTRHTLDGSTMGFAFRGHSGDLPEHVGSVYNIGEEGCDA